MGKFMLTGILDDGKTPSGIGNWSSVGFATTGGNVVTLFPGKLWFSALRGCLLAWPGPCSL